MKNAPSTESNDINEWGHTNNPTYIEAVRAFRVAAAADGWGVVPTYPPEPIDNAAKGTKEGFVFHTIARGSVGKWLHQASGSLWGPDGLAIDPPKVYDWNFIQAAVKHCNYCGADDVAVQRVGFAGRCCHACLPAVRQKVEYPGWTR